MIWLGGYCVLTWLVGLALVWSTRHCDDENEYAEELGKTYPGFWTAIHAMVVVMMPVMLPLILLFCGYPILREMLTEWKASRAAIRYREPQFEPINFFDLDNTYRDGFQRWTDEFLGQDFDLLGDFQTKFDPLPIYSRYFVGCEGTVFGEVMGFLDICPPVLLSVLEDGTYVESSGSEPYEFPGELTDDDLLCFAMHGDLALEELLEMHLKLVETEAAKRETRVLAFSSEQFREVAVYGERRFKSWRKRCGERTGEVPSPVTPVGEPIAPNEPCRRTTPPVQLELHLEPA